MPNSVDVILVRSGFQCRTSWLTAAGNFTHQMPNQQHQTMVGNSFTYAQYTAPTSTVVSRLVGGVNTIRN